jgi:putative chitinase
MRITIDFLNACFKNSPDAAVKKLLVDALNKHLPAYGINTRMRVAHFIAQCLHETGDFNFLIENMNYSAQGLANTWPGRFSITGKGGGAPNALATSLQRQPIAIGNYVYANRYGNGDTASGDGYRYRGRGPFHLTFKNNYKAFGAHAGVDLVAHPEDVQGIDLGVTSACWFWATNDCNKFADADDIIGVTKKINGGTIGLKDREAKLARVKTAMKDHGYAD